MRNALYIALLASALVAPAKAGDDPSRGLSAVNVPVVNRSEYFFDAASSGAGLAPSEMGRLDAWFAGLNIDFGDRIYVEGANNAARNDVAAVAGRYGILLSEGAPVTTGTAAPGAVRVIVSRSTASMPTCPNWTVRAQPNWSNRSMSNFGCGVNGNLAAMVADKGDLVQGRADIPGSDGFAGVKAISLYREWELTGVIEGQVRRPLKTESTKSAESE